MPMQSNIHFYVNWAKERLDEMDATLTSFESKVAEVQADARDRADKVLSVMRKKRDEFQNIVKKQAEANEAGWITAQAHWSLNGVPSRPKQKNMSRASSSRSSNSRQRLNFRLPPN